VGVGLQNIGLDSATLRFDVEVKNPYSVPLPLLNLDYALASRGTSFLSGKADLQGTVPARDSKVLPLTAKVVFLDLLKALADVRPGQVVPYAAELGLSVDAPTLGTLRLPMKKEGELPVPAVPDAEVSEIRWDRLDLDEAAGRLRLNLVNRNAFPVDLSELKYTLSLGGVEVGESAIANPVKFDASGGAGQVTIPVSFSPRKAGEGLLRMLLGAEGGYRLRGTLILDTRFGKIQLPLDKTGQTLFRR
jgi:LEA14-like dessication related protein